MPDQAPTRQIARDFADAIDADDYRAAGRLLAGAAVYAFRGQRLMGRDKILAKYAASSEWARETFESVDFDSSVEVESETTARVSFVDRIEHAGQTLVHTSEQILEIAPERGRITHITHVDRPGEAEKLERFLEDVSSQADGRG